MKISVQFYSYFKELAGGAGTVEEVPAGTTIDELLKRVYVRPSMRGLGVGRELVEAAIARARELGFQSLYLDTIPGVMDAACHLHGVAIMPRWPGRR